jgi:hypothetical protein
MFKLKNSTFYVTRGDRGSFDLTLDDYTFKAGDTIEFKIYEEEGLDNSPVLKKEFNVKEASDSVSIELLSADTTLGDPSNEVITYWYEIKLNGDQTPFCYDELTGAKIFYLYPGGID